MASEVGFTLVEVMLSTAIGTALLITSFSFLAWQAKTYHSITQQAALLNASTSLIAHFRHEGEQAGYGMLDDPNVVGFFSTGDCLSDVSQQSDQDFQRNCTGQDEDGLSDRVKFTYGSTDTFGGAFIKSASVASTGPCPGGSAKVPPNWLAIAPNDSVYPKASSQPYTGCFIISGDCADGSDHPAAMEEVCYDSNYAQMQNVDGCAWQIPVYWQNKTFDANWETCSNGWKAGYSLAKYNQSWYKIVVNKQTGIGSLQRAWQNQRPSIISNISTFRAVYGIDLSDDMDGKLDPCPQCVDDPYGTAFGGPLSWCRDLNQGCGLTTLSGQPLTGDALYRRIIAVHLSWKLTEGNPDPNRLFGLTFALRNQVGL